MKDDEEILTQDEDELEEDISDMEEEEEKEEIKKSPKKIVNKPSAEPEEVNETYEGFVQPARLGIINTVTGEVIEGFKLEKDEGIVQLGKSILNKLDKIAIASGV